MSTESQKAKALSIRETSTQATRERLFASAEELLKRSEACTMRSVAAEAGIGERTIYRYFESREVLERELIKSLSNKIRVSLPEKAAGLSAYTAELYESFENNSQLIVGLVSLANGPLDVVFSRSRSRNLEDLERLLRESFPSAAALEIRAAAISTRTLLSGGSWVYMRVSCGLPNSEVTKSAQWAVRQTLVALARHA